MEQWATGLFTIVGEVLEAGRTRKKRSWTLCGKTGRQLVGMGVMAPTISRPARFHRARGNALDVRRAAAVASSRLLTASIRALKPPCACDLSTPAADLVKVGILPPKPWPAPQNR